MKESGYYPAGAEFDPRAPWNQTDPDEATRDVTYTCTIQRTVPVSTTEYTPGRDEQDEDGYYIHDDDDFSDTPWLTEFTDQYRTPAQLIALLREVALEFASGHIPKKRASTWQHIADDCDGWDVDDESAAEEQ